MPRQRARLLGAVVAALLRASLAAAQGWPGGRWPGGRWPSGYLCSVPDRSTLRCSALDRSTLNSGPGLG